MASILIVTDGSEPRASLRAIFETGGPAVRCAEADNIASALREAERIPPDLILISMKNDAQGVFDFVLQLKAVVPKAWVFLLADAYDINLEKRALAAGVNAVFCNSSEDLASLAANVQEAIRPDGE